MPPSRNYTRIRWAEATWCGIQLRAEVPALPKTAKKLQWKVVGPKKLMRAIPTKKPVLLPAIPTGHPVTVIADRFSEKPRSPKLRETLEQIAGPYEEEPDLRRDLGSMV